MAPKQCDTLLGQAEEASKPAKRRRLGRRSTDEAAARALAEHFASASQVDTDLVTVKGQTLRERIISDKRAAKASGAKLGSSYWQNLKVEYKLDQTSAASAEVLVVKDKAEAVHPELKAALEMARGANLTKNNISRLSSFLASAPAANQRELVGLLRCARDCRPSHQNGLQVMLGWGRGVTHSVQGSTGGLSLGPSSNHYVWACDSYGVYFGCSGDRGQC